MNKKSQSIEIEDLWKISSSKIKALTVLSLIFCFLITPFIQSTKDFNQSNINVLAIDNSGKDIGIKRLNTIDTSLMKTHLKKAIYLVDSDYCFSVPYNDIGKIICQVSNSYGAIKHISIYSKDLGSEKTYSYYEPTVSAKIGITLIFWLLFFATPIYFFAKKNADLSLIKEKIGKRKIFNFKN